MTTEAMTEDREEAETQVEMTPENCEVWQCKSCDDFEVGFLVTEPGRLDRLIAFAMSDSAESSTEKYARQTAYEIAENPHCLEVAVFFRGPAIDLRPFGKPDSNAPMPRWIYSLQCRPDGDKGSYQFTPTPYCRILHQQLVVMRDRTFGK